MAALWHSSKVVRENLPRRMYPTPGLIMKAASTLWTGIFPRVISKGITSFPRPTVMVTLVPEGPFMRLTMLSWGNLTPAITLSSTLSRRSPGIRPTFSDGPPAITSSTMAVSLGTLN